MSRTHTAGSKPSSVSRALARDRLGVPAVLFFVLAGVAPLTVAAGVIPTAYQTTGLTGIPAAFIAIAVILALFATGYVAMTRHITNSGAFYAFISRGIGRVIGVAAALVALLAYSFLQVGLYGACTPWQYRQVFSAETYAAISSRSATLSGDGPRSSGRAVSG
jgi:amino acid transporter